MPCNYNPETGEVETLYERYQREVLLDEILYQQYIAEKIDKLKEKMKSKGEDNARTIHLPK